MTIGEKIASLRKQQNLTQEQLARALDISVPAVSKWENGATMPDISLLAPIARMLHTDINDLFSFQKEITEKDVDIFMEQIRNECESKGYQEGMEQAFGLLGEYPNCPYLKLKIANAPLLYTSILDDARSLAEKLVRCIEHPKQLSDMGMRARKVYENVFSMQVFEENVRNVLLKF